MKFFFSVLLVACLFSACQEDPKIRQLKQEREAQKREVIFNNINKGWVFNTKPSNETSKELIKNWSEWRVFLNELAQKPKSSIGAFQQKSLALSKHAADLNNNIPLAFDLPEVKSRISVLATHVNMINLYLHLNQIPDKKVIELVQETNVELQLFQSKLDEITQKSKIKLEEGESDMLQMLDTTRAIPSATPKPVLREKQKRFPRIKPSFRHPMTPSTK